ncbi:MAG: J domain-containing protein [Proteobacteria bacterium]|nr:J domain-containing protein [Pseudomonadota bacterium]
MAGIAPLEIMALVKIIDELDYYQVLHLKPGASARDVKTAFHATARTFHPDANRHLDPELQAGCTCISKRVTEAYCVLRDRRRRKAYDEKISGGEGLRMQLAEAKAAHTKRQTEARQGRTPQGRQFFQKASKDLESENWASATNNLQMALTFEPDSELFKEKLEGAKRLAKENK